MNDVCLAANDVGFANDVPFGNDVALLMFFVKHRILSNSKGEYEMKRIALLFLVCLIFLFSIACSVQTRQNEVLNSVGKYDSKQFWTHGGFQDYTDFGIYVFSSAGLDNNQYFSPVSVGDVEKIGSFVDNFEGWIKTFQKNNPNDELVLNYVFDRSIIDVEDYFYIYEGENYPQYGCYDLWLFDTQTNVLYYFHNNI